MRRARPCQHKRRIKTKKGIKTIVVNKGIKKKQRRNYGMAMSYPTMKYLKDKGAEIYLVGGKPRDDIIKAKSKDIDYLVTGMPLEQLKERLSKRGSVNVDKNMGVIKFKDASMFNQDEPDDIVLPRTEKSTGEGHKDFEITYDHTMPIEKDLLRRDFTIGAIAKNALTGEKIDPLGGEKDLKNKVLRVIEDPSKKVKPAFETDPLRMMRGGQFASRFGLEATPKTERSMKKFSKLISTVPPERIAEELRKGFGKGKYPEKMYDLLNRTGVLGEILPETKAMKGMYQNKKYHKYDVDQHTRETVKEMGNITRDKPTSDKFKLGMSALLHDVGKPTAVVETPGKGRQFLGHEKESERITKDILSRLKLSKKEQKEIATLVGQHGRLSTDMSDKKMRQVIHELGPDTVKDLITFRRADLKGKGTISDDEINSQISNLKTKLKTNLPITYSRKDLAISGLDLKNKYNLPGKEIGEVQNIMHKSVITNPKLNTEEGLKQFIPKRFRR